MAKLSSKTKFKLINKLAFNELNESTYLYEADLTIQDSKYIYQFDVIDDTAYVKQIAKPGTFSISYSETEPFKPIQLSESNLHKDLLGVQILQKETNLFLNNLEIYDKINEPKIRRILLYGPPGCGKTAAIKYFCSQIRKQDPGVIILTWPTDLVDASRVLELLASKIQFHETCTKLILIIEDINGAIEGNSGPRHTDSSLLNLLDGVEVTFPIPTVIIATTNFPQNLLNLLADRPGRFDLVYEVSLPSSQAQIQLLEFILKKSVSSQIKDAISKYAKEFSLAHIKECAIRHLLSKKPLVDVIKEIYEYQQRVKNSFEEKHSMGF